jgi:uncharacterized Zn-finger protein
MMDVKITNDTEVVSHDTEVVKCDGGQGDLGHPAVYFKMTNKLEVVCNYCNKKFVKKIH